MIRNSLLGLMLVISSSLFTSIAQADIREEYLNGVTGRIMELQEELYYQFTDLALKAYCRPQYDSLMDYLRETCAERPRITLTELMNEERESALAELWSSCEQKDFVRDLEFDFNFKIANQMASLIQRLSELLGNDELGLTDEVKFELSDTIVSTEIAQNFVAAKVFEELTSSPAEESAVRVRHLQKTRTTVSIDYDSLAELERAAKLTQPVSAAGGVGVAGVSKKIRKGHCAECNKKIGLVIFPCPCTLEFCAVHRYPEEHHCTFDHKAAGRRLLEKANPVVVGDKGFTPMS